MKAFTYERVNTPAEAALSAQRVPGAKFIAGGTNLLDLMKLEIETPTHLIDVNGLGLDKIEVTDAGGLRIGALVRNTDLAAHERVRRDSDNARQQLFDRARPLQLWRHRRRNQERQRHHDGKHARAKNRSLHIWSLMANFRLAAVSWRRRMFRF